MKQLMTLEQVQALLQEEVNRAGGVSALARQVRMNHGDLSNCLAGRRLPTKKVLTVLHLRKVAMYERI
jgi:hypothetical protein